MTWLKVPSSRCSRLISNLQRAGSYRLHTERREVVAEPGTLLDLSWTLAVALRLQLSVKVSQLGLKVPAVRSRSPGSLQAFKQHTDEAISDLRLGSGSASFKLN